MRLRRRAGRRGRELHLLRQSAEPCAVDLLPLREGSETLIQSRLLRVRLRQNALQSFDMDLHPADDGVTRALDLIAQTARGNFDRFLLLGLSLAQKAPHDEDEHRPQDNQCAQNFRDHFSQLPLSP